MAHHARKHKHRGHEAKLRRELSKTRRVVINHCPRRYAMHELIVAKTGKRKRTGKSWSARGDDLFYVISTSRNRIHNLQKPLVSFVSSSGSRRFFQPAVMPIIVVQSAKSQTSIVSFRHQ